ncbi:MAG: hypothetical protein HWD92_04945 [Flavobacteriia bacterium]|nr:hypothetical protein [Flavobacteriia bacterium]
MQTILLEYPDASTQLERTKRYYKKVILNRRRIIQLTLLFTVGLYLTYTGFANDTFTGSGVAIGFGFGFGFGLLYCGILLIVGYLKAIAQFNKVIDKSVLRYHQTDDTFSYEITETGLTFRNTDSSIFHSWKIISSFEVKYDFILLFSEYKSPDYPLHIIPLTSLNSEKRREILELLHKVAR